MTAPNAAAYVFIGLVIIGGAAALAWAVTGWHKTAAADRRYRDIAATEECLYCRCLYVDADCTCPRRCTAMVCLAPATAARGLDQ